MLIVTAVLALVFGFCCWGVERLVRRQREAHDAFERALLADPDNKPSYEAFEAGHVFPYAASSARRNQIKTNYGQLRVGLRRDEVARLLGEPDCSEIMFSKGPRDEYLGRAWTYYLDKPNPKMVNLKDDKTVEVFFDPAGKVHWVVSNVEGLAEIGSPGS